MIIEICANSYASALAAQNAGADRIELCTQLSVGGLTPSFGLIKEVTSALTIPVHVLIRPKAGRFVYSETEMAIMKKDIAICKELGCAGIVSGALTPENEIDISATKQLIEASEGMEFTFHRAFDVANNPSKSLEQLIDLGVDRILTSGQQPKAINGLALLQHLLKISEEKIQIMPGSGINKENALAFKNAGFKMMHFSAIQNPQILPSNGNVSFDEGIEGISNENAIREIISMVS